MLCLLTTLVMSSVGFAADSVTTQTTDHKPMQMADIAQKKPTLLNQDPTQLTNDPDATPEILLESEVHRAERASKMKEIFQQVKHDLNEKKKAREEREAKSQETAPAK